MRVTVRRPGQSTQPVTRVRKSAEDGRRKRSVKRPSRRSQAMTGGSSAPDDGAAGDAEDIVCKKRRLRGLVVEQPFQRGRLPLCYSPSPASPSVRRQRLGLNPRESAKVHNELIWRNPARAPRLEPPRF